jgi:integrase
LAAAKLKPSTKERNMLTFLEQRGFKTSTAIEYLNIWRRVQSAALVEFADFDALVEALNQHVAQQELEGLSPATIRNQVSAIAYFYEANGFPNVLPAITIPVKRKKQLTQTLSQQEEDLLIRSCTTLDAVCGLCVEIILLTGIRLSELMALTLNEHEILSQRIYIPTPGGGATRALFLGRRAKLLLLQLRKKKNRPRGEAGRVRVNRVIKQACKDSKLRSVTPSELRMTFACKMLIAGYGFNFVAKQLGLEESSTDSRRRLKEILVKHLERGT